MTELIERGPDGQRTYLDYCQTCLARIVRRATSRMPKPARMVRCAACAAKRHYKNELSRWRGLRELH